MLKTSNEPVQIKKKTKLIEKNLKAIKIGKM